METIQYRALSGLYKVVSRRAGITVAKNLPREDAVNQARNYAEATGVSCSVIPEVR